MKNTDLMYNKKNLRKIKIEYQLYNDITIEYHYTDFLNVYNIF